MTPDPILLAIDSLSIGGAETQLVRLIEGLRRSARFPVMLALLDHGGELEAEAVRASVGVLSLGRKARFDWTPAVLLLWRARRARIRLIHASGWMSALAGLTTARCLGLPIINDSLRNAPPTLRRRERISRWCAASSDAVVANSHAALRAYGLSGHPRAQVIANGIDLTRFDAVTAEPAEPADSPTVCMVANFNQFKDQASVIRALACVRRTFPRTRLVLVGADRGTLADNRRLTERLGLSEAVRFVTNSRCPEPWIAASQVCVLSSLHESFSNAVLEYMAMAKPIVATDTCGDTARLIRDGESGFLVPPRSPETLAARIVELLRDPDRARRMGESARRQVQEFTIPRMVAAYEALYERLLTPAPTLDARASRHR
jgi:glycosyltransferase involved in cell wall biosynthesis